MHYVRFLKTPKITATAGKVILQATITITTDLGETYFNDNVTLAATLRAPEFDGDVYLRRTLEWTAGMRAMPISLDITRTEIEWPAKLYVGLKSKKSHMTDHFETFHSPSELPSIISAWSETLDATSGKFETSRRVERQFMPLTERTLSIYEDTGDSIARHLWDGSIALTAYIDSVIALQAPTSIPVLERALITATFKKLNVLELGCGCGVVGIAMAQTIPDCEVVLTDLPEVKELVARNIEICNPAMASSVSFTPLDWDAPLPPTVRAQKFDMIIAAECVYNTDSIPLLVNTLSALVTRSPKAVILVSTKFRHESERMFFDLTEKAGLIEAGKTAIALPGQPGYGYGDFSTHVDLHVFHGKNYRSSFSPVDMDKAFELSSGSE